MPLVFMWIAAGRSKTSQVGIAGICPSRSAAENRAASRKEWGTQAVFQRGREGGRRPGASGDKNSSVRVDVFLFPRSMRSGMSYIMRSAISVLAAVILCTLSALAQEAGTSTVPADMVYGNPGRLVNAGGFRLNLYCMGSGSPTVVFDSGWGDWAPAWSKVQPQIAKWTRACS